MSEQKKNLCETPCRDCVFARYAGKTQTGCAFDRVEKYRRRGIEVVEAYDEEKEFFVIKTACHMHKHAASPWAKKYDKWNWERVAREELTLRVDVVLVMTDHTLEQVKATVDSLLSQRLLPQVVTVVVNQDGVKVQDVRQLLPADWVVHVTFERKPDGSRVDSGPCIDNVIATSTSHFYATFTPGFVVPQDFVSSLDKAVNDDLERFSLLIPNAHQQGMVVQTKLHRYVGGYAAAVIEGEDAGGDAGKRADSLLEKVRHVAKVNDMEYLIKKVEDVCPSLS